MRDLLDIVLNLPYRHFALKESGAKYSDTGGQRAFGDRMSQARFSKSPPVWGTSIFMNAP